MLREPTPPQPATPSSSFSGSRNHAIFFKHPGYVDDFEQNVFLRLYSFDRAGGGLHYGTAIVACGIIAGNKWDGHFKRTRDGSRIQLSFDEVLTLDSYYFYPSLSSADDHRYPIYPFFADWAFPHGNLPQEWGAMAARPGFSEDEETSLAPPSASNLTSAIIRRDGRCRMTGQQDYIETAHLCPRSEALWFESNGMGRYNINGQLSSDYIVEDIANAIALRPDCHSALDDRKFVIVPKETQWAAHFLGLTNDLGRFHHNTPIELDPVVSTNYVFTRFAWAVFPLVRQFLEAGVPRDLRLRVTEDGEFREIVKTVPPGELRGLGRQSRSRSTSPKKRKAGGAIAPQTLLDHKRRRLGFDDSEEISGENDVAVIKDGSDFQGWPGSERDTAQLLRDGASAEDADSDHAIAATNSSSTPAESTETRLLIAQNIEEIHDLNDMKRAWIRRQRPQNPAKYCCDYPAAEAALRAGLPGKREYGGGHLCPECLGFEYENGIDDFDEFQTEIVL